MNKIKCQHCRNEEGVYLFAILNGKEVYDCPICHKRTILNNEVNELFKEAQEGKDIKKKFEDYQVKQELKDSEDLK